MLAQLANCLSRYVQGFAAPRMSTYWPGTKCAAVTSVPTGSTASGVTLNSCRRRLMGTPAAAKCPRSLPQGRRCQIQNFLGRACIHLTAHT